LVGGGIGGGGGVQIQGHFGHACGSLHWRTRSLSEQHLGVIDFDVVFLNPLSQ